MLIGKRACMGESLARNTFYLFTAALVKTFNFSAVSHKLLPTLEPINDFTLNCEGFETVILRRN